MKAVTLSAGVCVLVGAIWIRTHELSQPLTDVHHVRQSDTASIARNMVRSGIDLWHPKIDWVGPAPQTVESEFPLYNAILASVWSKQTLQTTTANTHARAVTITLWVALMLVTARLTQRINPNYTLFGLIFMAFSPLGVVFSRTVQPDVLAVLLMMLAYERIDHAIRKTDATRWLSFVTAAICSALAIAVKGTTLFFFLGILFFSWKRCSQRERGAVGILALASIALAGGWYYHAHINLGDSGASFNIWRLEEKWGGFTPWFTPHVWLKLFEVLFFCILTPFGALCSYLAVAKLRKNKGLAPIAGGILGGLLAVVMVTDGFFQHEYYWLPITPFISILFAAGCVKLIEASPSNMVRALVLLALLGSFWRGKVYVIDAQRRDVRVELAGEFVRTTVPENQAVVIYDTHPQSVLYQADRRGWCRSQLDWKELKAFLEDGGRFIAVLTSQPLSVEQWKSKLSVEDLEVHHGPIGYILDTLPK